MIASYFIPNEFYRIIIPRNDLEQQKFFIYYNKKRCDKVCRNKNILYQIMSIKHTNRNSKHKISIAAQKDRLTSAFE